MRDVRKMIYRLLTPLERVTVEKAHGVLGRAFERDKKDACMWAAQEGYLEVLQGLVRMVFRGVWKYARLQQEEDIWKFSNGNVRMAVRGAFTHVRMQQKEGT